MKINEGDMHGGTHHHCFVPYYDHMVDLYKEGVIMELCRYCCGRSEDECDQVKLSTTAKEIYQAYTNSFPPPRVEYKPEYSNVSSAMWGRVWERVASPMLDPMARQVVWRAVNNILPTRERQNRLGLLNNDDRQVISTICNRCDHRNSLTGQREVDNVTHMFSGCGLVKDAWKWIRVRLLSMLPDDMSDLSNTELLHMFFPKERQENDMVWLVGTYMGWAFEEGVMKGRILLAEHAEGYMRYMYYQSLKTKMPEIGHITGITVFPVETRTVFDDNG